MNLNLLKRFSSFLNHNPPFKLHLIKRIGDNLFKLDIAGNTVYFDLSKGKSCIFVTEDLLLSPKSYNAPFDKSLAKYCTNAFITKAQVDGENRILQLFLETKNSYKTLEVILQAEFTGRNTNLILLDKEQVVLDALRHITSLQSFREVRINKKLLPLPQPLASKKVMMEKEGDLWVGLKNLFLHKKQEVLGQKILRLSFYIQQKILHLQGILASLENKALLEQKAKEESGFGKTIIHNLYQFADFKGKEIELEGKLIVLPSKAHSLSQAAQIFFENSKKLHKKAQNIYIQENHLKEKIDFYQNLLVMVQNVTNIKDLEILDSNFQKDTKKTRSDKAFESFFIEGFKISIGKSEKENIALLKEAKAEDLWLHIRDIPSSHCIIHCGKSKIPDIIIHKAAQILVGLLKKYGGNYEVDYTKRKFVKIIEGAKVVYAKEQTLRLIKE
ncbi:MAG: NFACT family protein [Helicobacter sp.]|nr:NFACT family protein [Helicobacter sp.]